MMLDAIRSFLRLPTLVLTTGLSGLVTCLPTHAGMTREEPGVSRGEPATVTLERDLNATADSYEEALTTDPRFQDPSDPETRRLRSRLILHRTFADALDDFNERSLGER